jgi:drug/metabolite transporter (DMT)-like permease
MIAALLVIITNSLVFVIFKLFQRYQVHIKRAIIINYTTAVIISYFAIRKSIDFNLLWNAKWIIPAVIIGIIYVLNFYLINLCTKNFNLAVTSLSGKISVVIPILIGIIILHEAFGWTRVVGILLALLSLFLILKPKNPTNFKLFFNTPAKILKLFIPIALFLFYGISDAFFQVSQK